MEKTEQYLQTLIQQADKREQIARRRAIFYSIAPLLLAAALIWFTSYRIIQARHELSIIEQELEKKKEELKQVEEKKKIYEAAIPNALKDFGWLSERVPQKGVDTISIVEQSFQANKELQRAISTSSKESREAITIQYFPKDVDQKKVEDALQELGFTLEKKLPLVRDVPTNAIWFGEKVKLDDVKLVAYTLTRAGVQIRGIEHFRASSGPKALLIQVGASRFIENDPVFTVEGIRALAEDDLQGRQRTYGDQ